MINYIRIFIYFRTLTDEQRQQEDGLLLFSVKDKDLLGYNNQYIGEAFLRFKDIEDTIQVMSSLPQVHLQLSRPTELSKSTTHTIVISYHNRLFLCPNKD